jgi:hypothetical protein
MVRWRVENLRPDEAVTFPLLLICGQVPLNEHLTCVVVYLANAQPGSLVAEQQRTPWPVRNCDGRFRALLWLQPGVNLVAAGPLSGPAKMQFRVHYLDVPWDYVVRAVYVVPRDAVEVRFQAPPDEDCMLASAVRRFALALRLMQTAAAELLHEQGLGHLSFCIERMSAACATPLPANIEEIHCAYEVPVHVRRLSRTRAELHALSGDALWGMIAEELSNISNRQQCIDVAVMSFTSKDASTGRVYGHTALGGGTLALFGSSGMYAWPQTLSEVPKRFSDRRRVDSINFFDDSAGRGERWALASTTIGAMLHELGHCLSLPHPCRGGGIMARGFDYFYRLFTVQDPDPEREAHEPHWDRSAACRLHFHRHFVGALAVVEQIEPDWASFTAQPAASPLPSPERLEHDARVPYQVANAPHAAVTRMLPVTNGASASERPSHPLHAVGRSPRITLDANGFVHIFAPNGIGHIGYYVDGDVADHDEFLDSARPVEYFQIALDDIRRRCRIQKPTSTLRISCIDHLGEINEQAV